jgi:uncharacterized membrane protein
MDKNQEANKPIIKRKENRHPILTKSRTLGEKTADSLTKWAGSWFFIITFLLLVAAWIYVNGALLLNYGKEAFDPFPYILLNLALSLLAALQAPVILMSQNRQSQIDRLSAEYDYAVNRKSSREIDKIQKQLKRIEGKLNKKR